MKFAMCVCIESWEKVPNQGYRLVKFGGFHEIWWISWNPADFSVKSGGFHEIWWISFISTGKLEG